MLPETSNSQTSIVLWSLVWNYNIIFRDTYEVGTLLERPFFFFFVLTLKSQSQPRRYPNFGFTGAIRRAKKRYEEQISEL